MKKITAGKKDTTPRPLSVDYRYPLGACPLRASFPQGD
jgi:hypothetical protein